MPEMTGRRFESPFVRETWHCAFPRGPLGPAALRQLVPVVDEAADRGVEPVQPGIARLDQVVLVGGVRAAAVAQSEVAGRQLERLAGEHVARPGAGEPRPQDRLDPGLLVD